MLLKESHRTFAAIVNGKIDDYPEMVFFNLGTIDDVKEKTEGMKEDR